MYSVGIVLFQIASLQYPYTSPANPIPSAFQEMHMFQPPKLLRAIRNDLPTIYYQIVEKLLAKNPNNRFQTWQEVLDSLEKAWIGNSKEPLSTDALLMTLVDNVGKKYEEKNQKMLDQEKIRAKQAELRKINNYQWDQLGCVDISA